ncbi:hypothetical protein K491DRAFT_138673 [Lophiostoma macrostomum CBS 122681]|uniref:Uncharacterized protein n=1 Tax=Lophiostoma macrostomum CBS 122681 TaxID=1314788 RepID=A0A6A6STS6_9PLEO|nr:hypothetical protein K491DRAFT_138673 [Lophiostoma macrostomum CBS 122681]
MLSAKGMPFIGKACCYPGRAPPRQQTGRVLSLREARGGRRPWRFNLALQDLTAPQRSLEAWRQIRVTNTDNLLFDLTLCLLVADSGEVLGISTCQPSLQFLDSFCCSVPVWKRTFSNRLLLSPGRLFLGSPPSLRAIEYRLSHLGLSAVRLPSCSVGFGAIHLDVGKYPPAFYPDPLHFDPCSPRPIPKDRCWKRPPDKRPALRPRPKLLFSLSSRSLIVILVVIVASCLSVSTSLCIATS